MERDRGGEGDRESAGRAKARVLYQVRRKGGEFERRAATCEPHSSRLRNARGLQPEQPEDFLLIEAEVARRTGFGK